LAPFLYFGGSIVMRWFAKILMRIISYHIFFHFAIGMTQYIEVFFEFFAYVVVVYKIALKHSHQEEQHRK
jgi:hypothetical protein